MFFIKFFSNCSNIFARYIIHKIHIVWTSFFIKGWFWLFQNWWKWGDLRIFARKKGEVHSNGDYTEIFQEIPHSKKILMYLYIFPLLANIHRLNKIDDWHCNSFNDVDSYNSCINYLSFNVNKHVLLLTSMSCK